MKIRHGAWEEIGWRESQEDAYAVYDFLDAGFFSAEVYDGHGGKAAAAYAAEMLTPLFRHLRAREEEKAPGGRRGDVDLLREAYLSVDRYIKGREHTAGTTAATLHILGDRFLAANAGDSRVVIGTAAGVEALTEDHKPGRPGERARILSLGGRVISYGVPRVEGILAVSRSLGDGFLSPFVSPEPRITEGFLGTENDFAVLACDGVWDVLSPEAVMEIARRAASPAAGAELAGREALDRGSTDNITVICVDLRPLTWELPRRAMDILSVTDFGAI